MIPSAMLRYALEDEQKPDEEQKTEPTTEATPTEPPAEETPAADAATETPTENKVPTDAEREEKLKATQAQKEPTPAPESVSEAPASEAPAGEVPATSDEDEEPAQKKLKKEKEYVFYGKVVNFDELRKCKNVEYQEQYEVKIEKSDKNAVPGRIRVRKSVKGEKEPRFVLTTKTKLPDGSEYESDCKTTEENFIQFKYFAEGGMIKDRYRFPVEGYKGLHWEVDVFTGQNGLFQEWVKIDLEFDDENIELSNMPAFPIQLTDVITNQNGERTPEEEAIVRTLYDTLFRSPNPIVAKK